MTDAFFGGIHQVKIQLQPNLPYGRTKDLS